MYMEGAVDLLYKKGFEIAYWLRRGNNPHLRDIIQANSNGNEYHKGLLAGKKEAEIDVIKEINRLRNELRNDRER